MARSSVYAQTPYGQADAAFCALMAEILAWDMRRDVRSTAVLLAVCALTRVWPASHFTKKERAKWSHKAAAAFQTSERELAELTGFSQKRVHTALDKMQEAGFSYDGIVLNAGAYTHTSIALHDCIRSLKSPVIEVHISNVHQREEFRHHSMISSACKGVICGFGLDSYRLAIEALIEK